MDETGEIDEHGPFLNTVDRQVTMLVARLAELACKEPLSRVNQVDLHTILGSAMEDGQFADDAEEPGLAELRRSRALELAVKARPKIEDSHVLIHTARLFEKYLDQG